MADHDSDHAYGTAAPDAPATRAELERAVRSLNMSDLDLRDALLKLAARVIALCRSPTWGRRVDQARSWDVNARLAGATASGWGRTPRP